MKICAKLTVLYIVCYNKETRNVSLSSLFPPIYKCNLSYSGDSSLTQYLGRQTVYY